MATFIAPISTKYNVSRAPTTCSTSPPRTATRSAINISRRDALALMAATIALNGVASPSPAIGAPSAATATFEEVTSDKYGYKFRAPLDGWTKTVSTLGGRDLIAFVKDDSDSATNITMVATAVSGDYMKLTSFGNMETVLQTVVPDGRGGVQGELIGARLDNAMNAYVIEYTVKPGPAADKRHLITVFSLQPGRYLLTLTAQTLDDRWASEEKLFRDVAASYKLRNFDEEMRASM